MSRFNADFFDKNLNNVHHDTIEMPEIDDDYLNPETSEIYISRTDKVVKPGFIYITGEFTYFGLVTEVTDDEHYTIVTFKPVISLFEQMVLFDTDNQLKDPSSSQGYNYWSLERAIQGIINRYWINSGDPEQNWLVFETVLPTEVKQTRTWNFYIPSDSDKSHYAIIDFYSDFLTLAMEVFSVGIQVVPDFARKMVQLKIGKPEVTAPYLEADMPWCTIETFEIDVASNAVNKYEIYNSDDYSQKRYYFLNTDNTVDKTTTGVPSTGKTRVTPVVLEVAAVVPSEDNPFDDAADEYVVNAFGDITKNNHIELYITTASSPLNPDTLEFGQTVNIIHKIGMNGDTKIYPAIFTGRSLSPGTQRLVFGTVRTELTKILKKGGK